MPGNPDKWKIRFGQILQSFLQESGRRLEDFLYFLPADTQLDKHSKNSIDAIDLHVTRNLYEQHFSEGSSAAPSLDREAAKRLNATLVIVPGIGHHLAAKKVFEEQFSLLEKLGFPLVYAFYEDSLESNEKCAERLSRIVLRDLDAQAEMIFLGYSKGSVILMEMLGNPRYTEIANRTRAVVSLAGALRGSPLASSQTARAAAKLLKAYRRFSRPIGFATRLSKWGIRSLSRLPVPAFRDWGDMLKKAEDFQDDLIDLPEGILDLCRRRSQKRYSDRPVPPSVKLFSLSAVYPEETFTRGIRFISNPDDLFLYVSGRDLYNDHVCNDTQVLLPDSKYYDDTGEIVDLGIVKADHWGIALSNVLCRTDTHTDPFPRTEMLKAILVTLDEYFQADQEAAH
jgi:hypothetical protein